MSTTESRPESPAGHVRPPKPQILNVREAMWRIRAAWMFGSAWMHVTTGVALNLYADQVMRMPLFWLGVLGALPFVGAFAALPASYAIARYGRRKRIFMAAGMACRAVWVPIALIPWVLPRAWWWPSLIALHALASFGTHVMSPAVLSWFADVIPGRLRGRFFSTWNQSGAIVGLIVGQFVAHLLDHAASPEALTRTISIAFAAAAAIGVADFLWLAPLPDPGHRPNPRITLRELFGAPLADCEFRCFLAFNGMRTLSVGYLAQFAWLYLRDVVGVAKSTANLIWVVVPTLVFILVLRPWGRLVDRFGCKPCLIIGATFIVHGAGVWVFITPEHFWCGYVGVLIAVASWTGVEVASFNLMLRLSASHGGKRQGSAYLAINSVVMAVAATASGVLGGGLANWLGEAWRGEFLEIPLTYHGVLFLISSALRVLAIPWLFLLHEPASRTPTDAVRYVLLYVREHLLSTFSFPLRVFRRLGARGESENNDQGR